ncbi:MAG TPA: PrsW family glutamic-type intramembrane protease [Aggregatilineales bacterium]|nr:PrsW family intramembrane metalloprotease [Anaerolineales bacterium]HRE48914.1 PrsW family glutamic-type intramembrane protease [Aggregatilineales bacterium]
MSQRPISIRPRRADDEARLYRPVWRTAWTEAFLLIGAAIATIIVFRALPFRLNADGRQMFGLGFALLPLVLWYLISFRAEQRAIQPRERLLTVMLVGGLCASGIGLPITERLFAVEEWLPNAAGFSRVIGYTLCLGITQEFLKYAAMRYTVFPDVFRTRLDGIAYAMATALGYATVIAIDFVLRNDLTPDGYALRITEIVLPHVAISTILGYCLVALRRETGSIFLVPLGLIAAAFFAGLAVVMRGGLIVGGVSTAATGNNAPFGLAMAIFIVVLLYSVMNFLIRSADNRESHRARPEFER